MNRQPEIHRLQVLYTQSNKQDNVQSTKSKKKARISPQLFSYSKILKTQKLY